MSELSTAIACHREALYPLAWQLTRNTADAQDLVQDTLIKALTRHEQLESAEKLLAWLRTILLRIFLNRYKRRKKVRFVSDAVFNTDDLVVTTPREHPDSIVINRMTIFDVRDALEVVPDKYRDCIILADLERVMNFDSVSNRKISQQISACSA
jgi:RNA polymerase sigma-70 factor, ECF subfamily